MNKVTINETKFKKGQFYKPAAPDGRSLGQVASEAAYQAFQKGLAASKCDDAAAAAVADIVRQEQAGEIDRLKEELATNREVFATYRNCIKSALDEAGAPTHHPDIGAPARKPMTPQERIKALAAGPSLDAAIAAMEAVPADELIDILWSEFKAILTHSCIIRFRARLIQAAREAAPDEDWQAKYEEASKELNDLRLSQYLYGRVTEALGIENDVIGHVKNLKASAEKAELERGICEDNAMKLQAELNEAHKEIKKLHKIIRDEYPEDQAKELIKSCKKKK